MLKSINRMSLRVYDRNSLQEAEACRGNLETINKILKCGSVDAGKDVEHRPLFHTAGGV